MPKLCIIWDFDGAIGQINSQYPYNFNYKNLTKEIENVRTILSMSEVLEGKMIFAITGIAAEDGIYPYCIKDLIVEIHERGHEIASHSWKHEWFPFLEKSQVIKSLRRSKIALENCIGDNSVIGFIPPFNRPMSWYGKFAFSLGDKKFGKKYPGSNLDSLISLVHQSGYEWMRIAYNPLIEKFFKIDSRRNLSRNWIYHNNVLCIPHNYCGFDTPALELIDKSIELDRDIVISGHPLGLSLNNKENIKYFKKFLLIIKNLENSGEIELSSMQKINNLVRHE